LKLAREPHIQAPTFFLTAAEHSGDALGASLITALRRIHPEARFIGVGGPKMAAAGCRLLANPVARSAMLVGAVITETRYWYRRLKEIRAELASLKPDVVIPIDSSTVNLRVAKAARQRGIPVCYYVAPQLWASRPWRIGKLRACINTLCCVLPFEEKYFRDRGVHAVYVGHPMFDQPINTPDHDPYRLDPPLPGILPGQRPNDMHLLNGTVREGSDHAPRVAIFPGSRKGEIAGNLPPMLEIMQEIKGRFPRVGFVAAAPSGERAWQIRHFLRQSNTAMDIRVGHTDAIIQWADIVLTKSGTATLQIARHHTPMVVLYAVAAWKWHLAGRYLINTPFITLVNILAGRELVPEYVPFYGSPLPVAREVIDLIAHPDRRAAMSGELAELVAPLQPQTGADGQPVLAADRVAAEVVKLMGS